MLNLQSITGNVDEAAGALYEGDVQTCCRYLKKAKIDATDAINLVVFPWCKEETDSEKRPEDRFTIWSKTWLKVVNEVSRPIDDAAER